MNIVDRGYQTIVPPINHKVMEVSNVAFFPGLSGTCRFASVRVALRYRKRSARSPPRRLRGVSGLIFFSFASGGIFPRRCNFLALWSIVAHPGRLLSCCRLFRIAFSDGAGRVSSIGAVRKVALRKLWAALHGIVMSATRIVGVPCAAFPVVRVVSSRKDGAVCATASLDSRYGAGHWFNDGWQYSVRSSSSFIASCAGVVGIFICSPNRPVGALSPITSRFFGRRVIAGSFPR